MPGVNPKQLGVCTLRVEDLSFLRTTLTEYFGGSLEIVAFDGNNPPVLPRSPKVILCTIHTLEKAAAHFPDSRILEAKRFITGRYLEELIKFRSDKPVLVANNSPILARETVDNLRNLGINHLELVPYWHGCDVDLKRFDTILYPGIRAHLPDGPFRTINIGPRGLALSTFFEVLQIYGLPLSLANKFLDSYRQSIVEGCYRIDANLREMRKLKEKYEQVCDSSTNVEVGIDKEGVIQAFNRKAESFFDRSKERVMGVPYADCLHDCPELIALLDKREDVHDEFAVIQGKNCLVNVSLLRTEGGIESFLTVTPIQELQQVEAKARASLRGDGFAAEHHFNDIRGGSAVIRRAVDIARLYAGTDATVLLTGESGTGKELFAQAIHNASARAGGPFVGVNLAALPETLAESELFGYVEGAFTGAVRGGKAGLFEVAHGGTIFLDEIGDMSPSVQSKLLRVLEERKVIRVGGTGLLPIDVRVICATNRPLESMVRQGLFREDLYYRIRVLNLHIPPLRERKEDIVEILRAWGKAERLTELFPPGTLERLRRYGWPGNVRELKSIMEYVCLLERQRTGKDFSPKIRRLASDLLDHFFLNKSELGIAVEAPSAQALDERDMAILRQIAVLNAQGKPAGRYSLAEQKALQRFDLTATKLRLALQRLSRAGYLIVGRTRQGVALSPQGIRALSETSGAREMRETAIP